MALTDNKPLTRVKNEQFKSLMDPSDARKHVNAWSSKGFFRIHSLGDKIQVGEIQTKSAHTVCLKTQYEERTIVRSSVPHAGGPVDNVGKPPQIWDIPFERPTDFKEQEQKLLVPHTDSIEKCTTCEGKGNVRCPSCHGLGKINCPKCNGTGRYTQYETRSVPNVGKPGYTHKTEPVQKMCMCMGGKVRCSACAGRGTKVCGECQGHGALKFSNVLNVRFHAVTLTDFVNPSAVPDQLIQASSGDILHENRAGRITDFPGIADEIDRRTRDALRKSQTAGDAAPRILFQNLCIQRVPVHDVSYQYSHSGPKRLWIYGKENSVYAPDAPRPRGKILMIAGAMVLCVLVIVAIMAGHK